MQIITGLETKIQALLESLMTKDVATLLTKGMANGRHMFHSPPSAGAGVIRDLHDWEERTISSFSAAFPASSHG